MKKIIIILLTTVSIGCTKQKDYTCVCRSLTASGKEDNYSILNTNSKSAENECKYIYDNKLKDSLLVECHLK